MRCPIGIGGCGFDNWCIAQNWITFTIDLTCNHCGLVLGISMENMTRKRNGIHRQKTKNLTCKSENKLYTSGETNQLNFLGE